MGETLLISDLHLSADHPRLTDLFVNFLRRRAVDADALYILGDLFDAWIGDDDESPLATKVRSALKAVSNRGVWVYVQHGNRDFLLGNAFARATGCELLDETVVAEIAGKRTLLMHGDLLCSDDTDYQQARVMLRTPAFIADFLAKSPAERALLAAEYRKRSGEALSRKAEEIMDANPSTVADYLRHYEVERLIHGHTHREGRHTIDVNDTLRERYVLGDWSDERGSVLVAQDGRLTFEAVEAPARN